ncbi:tetratricopeptide repeat protein [Ensifer aridi]|uniref:tetratricopeptide repeat protein n=1 Tax=Ensifer aridi TaxID=1708715 RepID=UPI0009BE870E|nr:tetratricopeptide repeat protein [Ensifer aridi]
MSRETALPVEELVTNLRLATDRHVAIDLIRSLAPISGADADRLLILRDKSWHFGFMGAAAAFGKQLLKLRSSAGDHMSLSAILDAQSDWDGALRNAITASDLDPDNFDFALHAGSLANRIGRFDQAKKVLDRALLLNSSHVGVLHNACFANEKLGFVPEAIEFAKQAFELDKPRAEYCILAANLMMRLGDFKGAADYLLEKSGEIAHAALFHRTLSGALNQIGEFEQALEQIESAIKLSPSETEFQIHRSGVLLNLGRYNDALTAATDALASDPDNLNIRRQLVTIQLELGDSDAAVAEAAELLRREPSHHEYAQCMQHVLFQRQDASVGIGDIIEQKRKSGPRRSFRERTLLEKLASEFRVIGAIFLREMRSRFGESRLGYVWVVVEPMIHMVALAVVFQFTMKGQPPLGDSFFFFYFTGLIPYQLFVHTTEQVSNTTSHNKSLLQLPPITNLNAMYARAALELYTTFLVIAIFTAGFMIFSVDAIPLSFSTALLSLLITWLLGLATGMINGVVNYYFHAWHHIFQIVQRFLYFTSGIFYVPAMMPLEVREILSWNPLLHAVDWFRTAFFYTYEPPWMSVHYLFATVLATLALGLVLEKLTRKTLRRIA